MISTKQQESVSIQAQTFVILAIGVHEAATELTQSQTLHRAFVRPANFGPDNPNCAQSQIMAFNNDYDAVYVAGFGTGAESALKLAAQFPDDIEGVILFEPAIQQPALADRLTTAANAALRHISAGLARMGALPQFAQPVAEGPNLPTLFDVTQPVLIFHPRTGRNADISVAAALQRSLGGPVEVQFVGPRAEIETMDVRAPAFINRCTEFTARAATGAEGRRKKRQQAVNRTATPTRPPQSAKIAPRPARISPSYTLVPSNAAT